jgi:hypothetical protein
VAAGLTVTVPEVPVTEALETVNVVAAASVRVTAAVTAPAVNET